ncbi:MAG TPA: phosphoribosyltransferase, partial [Acidimicrobiales bacterium]|nr:phosphoribosyltransferase [Acidimicrobiales bacterium]
AGNHRGGCVPWVYRDRTHAGEVLANHLTHYAGQGSVTVLALPRGGVPVAFPVARPLGAPLDILAVRKLGVPGHEELAMGAVAAGGVRVLNRDVLGGLAIDDEILDEITRIESQRLIDQEARLRAGRRPAPIEGKTVIVVDDGLATGSTMRAAVASAKRQGAARTVVAVPVGAVSSVAAMRTVADEVVCPSTPPLFRAVGLAYLDFSEVSDSEVQRLLAEAAADASQAADPAADRPGDPDE